jgi:hypothetical protein
VDCVRLLSAKPWVMSVESEFHGEWNELAIWISVSDLAARQELAAFETELFDFLSMRFPKGDLRFGWSIGLWCNGSPISAISPGHRPDSYCLVCTGRFGGMFVQCPRCEAN